MLTGVYSLHSYFHYLLNELISKIYINTLCINDIDYYTESELHPIFLKFYRPFRTTANGNCLYNMISISLIGNESLTHVLKGLTVFTLILLKNEVINVIKKDIRYNKDENSINIKYNSLIYDAKTNRIWGGEYHLLIISTFLSTNILIYGSNNNKEFFFNNITSVHELKRLFDDGIRTGAHLIYKPINNTYFKENVNNKSIFGHFCIKKHHYTSLVPINVKYELFIPKNIFII